jgi:SAM-dependent methyltransferase
MRNADATKHARWVREYYDHNTRRFLKWGRDVGTLNLHAALWPPEVRSLRSAMHYSNELIAREIERSPSPVGRVLDLGCGVGGSLFYLGCRLPGIPTFIGISLSPVQIAYARSRLPEGQQERFHFEEGSFLQLDPGRFRADFAFSIEAAAHGDDPEGFFAALAGVLRPGGRLVLIDDTTSDRSRPQRLTDSQRRLLETYRRHWLLPGLRDLPALTACAAAQGLSLIRDQNLTPYLRLRRPRDLLISMGVRLMGSWMERGYYRRALLGGDAKQKCYLAGLIHYRLLVFEKRPHAAGHG